MTEGPVTIRILEEFRRQSRELKEADRRHREAISSEEKRQKVKREKEDERTEEMVLAVLASSADIEAFKVELNTYDAATIEALIENEEALKKVREDLKIMLDKAYVLPDGRRVFKTEDGTRVFDEHGTEIKDVDPQTIGDERPRWERFLSAKEDEQRLTDERAGLHEYQGRIDAARDRLDDMDLTQEELDELRKDLSENMPATVRVRLPDAGALERTAAEHAVPEDQQLAVLRAPTTAKLDMPAL